MFVSAIETASKFTLPVVISQRFQNRVESGCGTFILLNSDGWILTAAHIIQPLDIHHQQQTEIADFNQKVAEINANRNLTDKQKRNHIAGLQTNPDWIFNISYWWGRDGINIPTFTMDFFRDLAIGRIENFNPAGIQEYPVFKNPLEGMSPGRSLCRLGYPFHSISSSFDPVTNRFNLAPGTLPIPRFPIEGIFTREAIFKDTNSGRQAKFLETSSPGLRGQSGGPIFDVNGNIWALQSRTIHLPLGFSPKIKIGNKEIEEHQFINAGLGTHVEEIINFLRENHVTFNMSS